MNASYTLIFLHDYGQLTPALLSA